MLLDPSPVICAAEPPQWTTKKEGKTTSQKAPLDLQRNLPRGGFKLGDTSPNCSSKLPQQWQFFIKLTKTSIFLRFSKTTLLVPF